MYKDFSLDKVGGGVFMLPFCNEVGGKYEEFWGGIKRFTMLQKIILQKIVSIHQDDN